MSSTLPITTTIKRRNTSIALFYVSLAAMLTAVVLNIPFQSLAMALWMLGIGIATGCIFVIQRTLSPSDTSPKLADEYQLRRISECRSRAMFVYMFGLMIIMLILLFAPLLKNLVSEPATWAELARTVGMACGMLLMVGTFTATKHLATASTRDLTQELKET